MLLISINGLREERLHSSVKVDCIFFSISILIEALSVANYPIMMLNLISCSGELNRGTD